MKYRWNLGNKIFQNKTKSWFNIFKNKDETSVPIKAQKNGEITAHPRIRTGLSVMSGLVPT